MDPDQITIDRLQEILWCMGLLEAESAPSLDGIPVQYVPECPEDESYDDGCCTEERTWYLLVFSGTKGEVFEEWHASMSVEGIVPSHQRAYYVVKARP